MRTVTVTDDRPFAAARRDLLDDERFDVVGQAASAPEVLPLDGRLGPELVVLDLDVSDFDGLDCVRQIAIFHPHVKVVVVTASADQAAMRAAHRRGARGCVVLRDDGRDLPDAIYRALAGIRHPVSGAG